ncbi:MAG TPA: ATP-binding cassette domain-containing protein, partial [Clostridia bacterium]|nr:ATP-binding cassette domain-containing protein [Clostridia bacterium]
MPININNLTHIYEEKSASAFTALYEVTVDIEDNEFIGVIGHTGSGKSTLIQHLNGLLTPTSGTVKINGITVGEKKADLKPLRRMVGMVFQYPEHQLFEETVYKDIAFGPTKLGLGGDEISERVNEAMQLVGLDLSLLQRSPFELSGGQKRRAAIAGVLAMRPSVLVLDEPI